jgi:hypothetical protein
MYEFYGKMIENLDSSITLHENTINDLMDQEKRLSAELVQAELEGNSNDGTGRDRRSRC